MRKHDITGMDAESAGRQILVAGAQLSEGNPRLGLLTAERVLTWASIHGDVKLQRQAATLVATAHDVLIEADPDASYNHAVAAVGHWAEAASLSEGMAASTALRKASSLAEVIQRDLSRNWGDRSLRVSLGQEEDPALVIEIRRLAKDRDMTMPDAVETGRTLMDLALAKGSSGSIRDADVVSALGTVSLPHRKSNDKDAAQQLSAGESIMMVLPDGDVVIVTGLGPAVVSMSLVNGAAPRSGYAAVNQAVTVVPMHGIDHTQVRATAKKAIDFYQSMTQSGSAQPFSQPPQRRDGRGGLND